MSNQQNQRNAQSDVTAKDSRSDIALKQDDGRVSSSPISGGSRMSSAPNNGGDGKNLRLLRHHEASLREMGIDADTIKHRGYQSLKTPAELSAQGFKSHQGGLPALLIPVRGISERTAVSLIRPDTPRVLRGRTLEFEMPKGSRLMIDVPENSRAKLADVTTRLWITDSPLQADVLASHGETSVAVLGARAWHHIQTKGQKPLNDWNSIPVRGREVIIAFNSDSVAKFARKSDVECLFHFLKQRGSIVRAAIPKPSPCGKRTSIDMFFKAGETPDSILGSLTSDACWEELMIETWFRQFEHPYVMEKHSFG